MANFKDHLRFGIITSALGTLIGHVQFALDPVQSGAAFIIGVLSSLAPDIDHPASVPGQLLFNALGIITPLAVVFYFPKYTREFALEHWIVILAGGYVFVRYIVAYFFARMTIHRGMFHSTPAIIICGQCIFLLFFHLPLIPRITIAAIGMVGYLTHLIADEMYSVDWAGKSMKLKKSAGTALDFGHKENIATWTTYLTIVALATVIYGQIASKWPL